MAPTEETRQHFVTFFDGERPGKEGGSNGLQRSCRAREARASGAPQVRKSIYLRKFGSEVSVLRPSVHSLRLIERNQLSARRGEEYVINRAMYLCKLRFSWREIAQEMAWPSRRIQKHIYFRNLFSSILSIRICEISAQFLEQFLSFFMAKSNSRFTYTFACKRRATGKRKKRKGIE